MNALSLLMTCIAINMSQVIPRNSGGKSQVTAMKPLLLPNRHQSDPVRALLQNQAAARHLNLRKCYQRGQVLFHLASRLCNRVVNHQVNRAISLHLYQVLRQVRAPAAQQVICPALGLQFFLVASRQLRLHLVQFKHQPLQQPLQQ